MLYIEPIYHRRLELQKAASGPEIGVATAFGRSGCRCPPARIEDRYAPILPRGSVRPPFTFGTQESQILSPDHLRQGPIRVHRGYAPSRWRVARCQPQGLLALVGVIRSFRHPAIRRCNPKNAQLH
jgi:hypothetical protein